MIQKMSHTTVYVLNQEEALKFYTDKLGFEVRDDAMYGENFRWLTVGPKNQPDMEIVLFEPQGGMLYDDDTASAVKAIIKKGALGGCVFETADCQATYEELKGRGVEFVSPPAERPYGIEAQFKDNSGNWFSLKEQKET